MSRCDAPLERCSEVVSARVRFVYAFAIPDKRLSPVTCRPDDLT